MRTDLVHNHVPNACRVTSEFSSRNTTTAFDSHPPPFDDLKRSPLIFKIDNRTWIILHTWPNLVHRLIISWLFAVIGNYLLSKVFK